VDRSRDFEKGTWQYWEVLAIMIAEKGFFTFIPSFFASESIP
jgi:hypothetical protein